MLLKLIRPFKDLRQYLLGALVISFLIVLVIWDDSFSNPLNLTIALFWCLTIFLTQWLGNVYIALKIDERVPILEYPVRRSIYGVIALIIYSVIAFLLVQSMMYYIFLGGIPENVSKWALSQIKISLPISFIISFVFSSLGFFQSWRKSEINAQKLETEMLRYKYETLQNQINPHFLFNSFNVLSDLVLEDQKLAVKFIQEMSGLYRYVLESKEKELVPLEEELDFIQSFIFLMKTRFEDKLDIKLDVEVGENEYIVPMALQLLVENAVKHNMATSSKVLHVEIIKEGNSIKVKNNLQLKSSIERSTKKGLQNLRQQYHFFTKREVLVNETNGEFVVEIPLLNKSNS